MAIALLMAATGAAAAQEMCGDPPLAPAIPSAAEIRAKTPADAAAARHSAFADIRRWQGSLKSYRDCLNATITTDKRKAGELLRSDKAEKDKKEDVAKLDDEIAASNHAYDVSVDQEERVVNEFHAAQVAYCMRRDVDISTCPKS
ncbi:MAG TPA: hypothetical protein VHT03_08145 [Rhizomicrobium sp.]|nr:hypothetical protein [Rhizomicrobium sp.]